MERSLTTEYWNQMLDMIPEFGKFSNAIETKQVFNQEKIRVISSHMGVASTRFEHSLLALDNLREIERDLSKQPNFNEEFDFFFKTEYHFFNFICSMSSYMNSLAWLLKHFYDISIKGGRQQVDIREGKDLLKKLKGKNTKLHEFILKNRAWIDELANFRDVALHRHNFDMMAFDNGRLFMPIHAEMFSFIDSDFVPMEEHKRHMKEVLQQKGGIGTQPMIPFCEDVIRKASLFSKEVFSHMLNEIEKSS
jgi:hypothetical protein